MYQVFWKNSNCTRFSVPGQLKNVSGFLPGWEIVPGRKVPGFEIFYFLAGWTLKFSAFGFLYTTPRLDLYVHYTFYVPGSLFMYQVLCTRFWIVPGFFLPGFLSFLKCTRFQSTRYFKKVSGLSYQVSESTRWKVPDLVLFWTTW